MITYDDQMTEEVRKRNADVWAVACNYREDTKVARDGAKAYVGHMGGGSGYSDLDVIVRSRGGRHVKKWERCRRLTNFRAKCVPVGHPLRAREDVWFFPTKARAEEHAALLMIVSRRDATALKARPQ
jgi:hypothetical protein